MPTALGPGAVCCGGEDPACEVSDCPKKESTPAKAPARTNPTPPPAADDKDDDQ